MNRCDAGPSGSAATTDPRDSVWSQTTPYTDPSKLITRNIRHSKWLSAVFPLLSSLHSPDNLHPESSSPISFHLHLHIPRLTIMAKAFKKFVQRFLYFRAPTFGRKKNQTVSAGTAAPPNTPTTSGPALVEATIEASKGQKVPSIAWVPRTLRHKTRSPEPAIPRSSSTNTSASSIHVPTGQSMYHLPNIPRALKVLFYVR